jgi:cytochrome c553
MKLHLTTLILAIFAGLVAVGCGSDEPTTNTETNTPADNTPAETTPAENTPAPAENTPAPADSTPAPETESEAAKVDMDGAAKAFAVCATCHGTTGMGDGAAAASFPVKPRSFSDKDWQAKVTDEHLAKVILEGGAAVNLSPLMIPSPQLASQPEVLAGLVKMIRDMGK